MLRGTRILTNIKFNYNNFNNWRRYYKNAPLQAEQKIFKKQFNQGDEAEFAYDNKIAWPEEYKPWANQVPFEYALGCALLVLYVSWRTDRQREKDGVTETHPYPI
jgi:hypothetical protein